MKKKIILIVGLLFVFSCQKSNSAPVGSENLNPGSGAVNPSVAGEPGKPIKAEWQKKLAACPLQLTQDMNLEQLAETSSQMRKQCGFTESEWAQVVRYL